MLFLLLCGAAPRMFHPTCNDDSSQRIKWIEIDSQILNALFCVTGFGLIPWRFRDLYFLLRWRLAGDMSGYIRLQEINQNWYRPRVDDQEAGLEAGVVKTATGQRAPPTGSWKLDYVIWMYVWNTFFQAVLAGLMWGLNHKQRPSWGTGLFVALGCIVAGLGGGQVWWETRKVKKIEGKRVKEGEEEKKELAASQARGVMVPMGMRNYSDDV